MKLKTVLLSLLILAILIFPVSAQSFTYQVQGEHTGTIILDTNGTGLASDGTHEISFTWTAHDQTHLTAHYWLWEVPFSLSPDGTMITSSAFPGYVAILKK